MFTLYLFPQIFRTSGVPHSHLLASQTSQPNTPSRPSQSQSQPTAAHSVHPTSSPAPHAADGSQPPRVPKCPAVILWLWSPQEVLVSLLKTQGYNTSFCLYL